MFLDTTHNLQDTLEHTTRQQHLKDLIKKECSFTKGTILLFGNFETDRHVFRQESSFYYMTGIKEPACVVMMDVMTDEGMLYIPNYNTSRAAWMHNPLEITSDSTHLAGISTIALLGQPYKGYQFHPFFPQDAYSHLIDRVVQLIEAGHTIFTLCPDNAYAYVEQRYILERLKMWIPGLSDSIIDISPLIAQMRRHKSMRELEIMFKAVEITLVAHNAAAQAITHDMTEAEVQASLEYMMIAAQAKPAFPSIVGSGKNSTTLHYNANNGTMYNGDLVVVDIGAQYDYYCADITRTYPVAGKFTKRQKEVYNIVLDTQEYIASIAKPGYWLNNKNYPEKSLHHLAQAFLQERGYAQYFVHGIGHYLGLDVHDVGDYTQPLQPGDVFTIEPGIYIAKEAIGIRIEDNYWVVEDEVICLSEGLPKTADQIERLMQESEDPEVVAANVDYIDFA